MKSAIIYARYSSEKQTEQSIEGQLRVCYEFAKKNDLTIVDEYIDRATTGTNDNRVAFQKMLSDSDKAKWEIVLVYAIDRFGRNSIETAVNKQRLKKNGKILISATQKTSTNIDGTQNLDGILLENVMIGLAEYYSAELSQKVKRGQYESRQKGLFCGGGIPFGFKIVEKRPVIDEESANIVRLIFNRYAEGKVAREIAEELNNAGLTHKGKPFLEHAMYTILSNTAYIGITKHGEEEYTNFYQPIIEKELFDFVQSKLARNAKGRHPTNEVFLLRGKVYCGTCGHKMNGESGIGRGNIKSYYYKCAAKKLNTKNCPQKPIRKSDLEGMVIDTLMTIIASPEWMETLTNEILKLYEQQKEDDSIIGALTEERSKAQTILDNIMSAIEQGICTRTTKERMVELENQLDKLDEQIRTERQKAQENVLTRELIEKFLTVAIQKNPQQMIDLLVNKVVVYKDKIEIHFKYKSKNDPDEPPTAPRDFYFEIISKRHFFREPRDNKANFFRFALFLSKDYFGTIINI